MGIFWLSLASDGATEFHSSKASPYPQQYSDPPSPYNSLELQRVAEYRRSMRSSFFPRGDRHSPGCGPLGGALNTQGTSQAWDVDHQLTLWVLFNPGGEMGGTRSVKGEGGTLPGDPFLWR